MEKEPRWYKRVVEECGVCGSTQQWTKRMYGEKPINEMERHEYKQWYCGCEERCGLWWEYPGGC